MNLVIAKHSCSFIPTYDVSEAFLNLCGTQSLMVMIILILLAGRMVRLSVEQPACTLLVRTVFHVKVFVLVRVSVVEVRGVGDEGELGQLYLELHMEEKEQEVTSQL